MKTAALIETSAPGEAEDTALRTDLVAALSAEADRESGARRTLLTWLKDLAVAGGALRYLGPNLYIARIVDEIGMSSNQFYDQNCRELLDRWAPAFPRESGYHCGFRNTLPGVDQRGTEVPRKKLLAALEREADAAQGNKRKLITHLIEVARGCRTLPNWNGGVNQTKVLRDAGIEHSVKDGKAAALRPIFHRWAGFYHLEEMLTVNRNGVSIVRRVGRVDVGKYIERLKSEGRRLYRSRKGTGLVSFVAVAHELNLPHTTITNHDCKQILWEYQKECAAAGGDGLGEVWPGLSYAERVALRIRREELMEYVRGCVKAGIPLPARADRRDAIDFDELTRRSGKPGATLSEDITFKRLIWEAGAVLSQSRSPSGKEIDYDHRSKPRRGAPQGT